MCAGCGVTQRLRSFFLCCVLPSEVVLFLSSSLQSFSVFFSLFLNLFSSDLVFFEHNECASGLYYFVSIITRYQSINNIIIIVIMMVVVNYVRCASVSRRLRLK